MREDTVRVYPFDELSDGAKKKAIEKLYDINMDYEWWDSTYKDAATIGFKITEFSLDRGDFCRGDWTKDAKDTARLILKNYGKVCDTYKDAIKFLVNVDKAQTAFEATDDYDPKHKEFIESDEYGKLCEEFRRIICDDYWIILRTEYKHLISEKAIIETIKANEYEFTADGTQY